MAIRIRCSCGKAVVAEKIIPGSRFECPSCGKACTFPKPAQRPRTGSFRATDVAAAAKAPRQDVKCDDCGATFRHIAWKEGQRCRLCRSKNIAPFTGVAQPAGRPAPKAGAATAKAPPEITGLTPRDRRFARLAMWARIVRPAQVAECTRIQKMHAGRGETAPFIGSIFLRTRYMTDDEITRVLEITKRPPQPENEKEFGRLAVQYKFMTPTQWEECQAAAEGLKKRGGASCHIEEVAVGKGFLAEAQAGALLDMQRKKGRGVLGPLDAASRPAASARVATLWSALLGSSWRNSALLGLGAAALIVVCVLISYGIAGGGGAGVPDTYVSMKCINPACSHATRRRNAGAPVTCDKCGQVTLMYRMTCHRCKKEWTFSDLDRETVGVVCPNCAAAYSPPREATDR